MEMKDFDNIYKRFVNAIKSLRNNPKEVTTEIVSNPRKALYYLLKGPTHALATSLDKIGIPSKTIMKYIDKLRSDRLFYEDFFRRIETAKKKEQKIGGWMPLGLLEIIYAIVRYVRPKIVVETGVGPGSSTRLILRALHDNNYGVLNSIDLPGFDKEYYPKIGKCYHIHTLDGKIGWLVPEELKYRWKLIIGDAKMELPKLLKELGTIDVFLHDSLHTYEHMMFEYTQAWRHLRVSGILMSDDVNEGWSLAFIDFCKERNAPYVVIRKRLGIARKVEHT